MIPFGPWHPDKAGINVKAVRSAKNVVPAVNGFAPLKTPVAATTALTGDCLGAAVVYSDSGSTETFAGDATKLYKLATDNTWTDVTRTAGGAYAASSSERWQFAASGALLVATQINDVPQKFTVGSSSNFSALGGSPPSARYCAIVRDFVMLGCLSGNTRGIRWSGLAQPEFWTIGQQSSDTQTFQNGGPVRGLLGGEVGYAFQAAALKRLTYVPGSASIFQIDEIEGGRGLAAPYALAKIGAVAYYLAVDGLYRLSLGSGGVEPLGVGKWAETLTRDIKASTILTAQISIDPTSRRVLLAYNSSDSGSVALNRLLIYDWAIDEATFADITVTTLAQLLTSGLTLDQLDPYGTVDTLPYSLDSQVWQGGVPLLGLFGADKKLAFFSGTNMAATIESNDGENQERTLIVGVRPHADARTAQVELSAREAEGDPVTWGAAEPMADTGVCPQWASGFLVRGRVTIPSGASWSKITGLTAESVGAGSR